MRKYTIIYIGLIIINLAVTANVVAEQSAGVLPYAFDSNGIAWVLLGEEYRTDVKPNGKRWKEFSGLVDPGDKGILDAAAREFTEETRKVYGEDMIYIKSCLKEENRIKHQKHDSYIYVVEIDYKPVSDFNSAPKDGEKLRYVWVTVVDLLKVVDEAKKKYPELLDDGSGRLVARFHVELPLKYVSDKYRKLYPNTFDNIESMVGKQTLMNTLK